MKRQKEESELIEAIDGDPIFTENDFEDKRITKLLQRRQSSNLDHDEQEIFLTDLLDIDSSDDNIGGDDTSKSPKDGDDQSANHEAAPRGQSEDESHREMLEHIFKDSTAKRPKIAGSQLQDDPMDISNVTDLQYAVGRRSRSDNASSMEIGRTLDDMADDEVQRERVTMSDMIGALNVPLGKAAEKQISAFSEVAEVKRLRLKAQSMITRPNLAVCPLITDKVQGFAL